MHRLPGLALFVLLLGGALPARAAVPLCVEVVSDDGQTAALSALVNAELGHHPSHSVVSEGCESQLRVELFTLDGARYLTARVGQQVPVRYRLESAEDADTRIREALSQVLRHDPLFLAADIREMSLVQRATRSILQQGHTYLRLELFQMLGRSDNGPVFLPGFGIALTRGSGHWLASARAYTAISTEGVTGTTKTLRLAAGLDGGLTWEASATAPTTFYAHAGIGLQLLRYTGRGVDQGPVGSITKLGAVAESRLGVRFLRHTDTDVDIFLAGYVPMFKTHDVDNPLFGEDGLYTPSLQIGVGVGF